MTTQQTLVGYITQRAGPHRTIAQLFEQAQVPFSIFVDMTSGIIPQPEILRQIAGALNIKPSILLLLANYLPDPHQPQVALADLPEDEGDLLEAYRKFPLDAKILLIGMTHEILKYH